MMWDEALEASVCAYPGAPSSSEGSRPLLQSGSGPPLEDEVYVATLACLARLPTPDMVGSLFRLSAALGLWDSRWYDGMHFGGRCAGPTNAGAG
eukprot:2068399-Amphidinium_carterae.1